MGKAYCQRPALTSAALTDAVPGGRQSLPRNRDKALNPGQGALRCRRGRAGLVRPIRRARARPRSPRHPPAPRREGRVEPPPRMRCPAGAMPTPGPCRLRLPRPKREMAGGRSSGLRQRRAGKGRRSAPRRCCLPACGYRQDAAPARTAAVRITRRRLAEKTGHPAHAICAQRTRRKGQGGAAPVRPSRRCTVRPASGPAACPIRAAA